MNAAQRIVDDLLNLEINIVLKPGMTARKMPGPVHALLDIIGLYDGYLCQTANTMNPIWEEHGGIPVQVRPTTETPSESPNRQTDPTTGRLDTALRVASVLDIVSESTFDELRERAVEAEAVHRYLVGKRWLEETERGVVLTRIYRNCDQIKAMLIRPELKTAVGPAGVGRDHARSLELPLASDELVAIRKIWEIGVETVVMQTVAQLDGDIITRIQQGRDAASNKPLHDLHEQAVGTALRNWQFLAQTVAQFVSGGLRFFLRPG